MQLPHYIALILPLFILLLRSSQGYDDNIASPVQMMQRVTFNKAVSLENSAEVYAKLSDLTRKHDLFNDPSPELETVASLAWATNSAADAKKISFQVPKGISIYQAVEQIATDRGEVVINKGSYLLIRKPSDGIVPKSYQINSPTADFGLTKWIGAVIPPGETDLLAADGELIEEFINIKLKESLASSQYKQEGPFTFRIDQKVRPRLRKANVVGRWCYSDLMDALCASVDLRWKIEGKTIRMEGVHEAAPSR